MNIGRAGPSVVVLNVGGTRYSLAREVLKDFPLRRVSRLHGCLSEQDVLEVCDDYDHESNEYFFDRHSEAFGFIMLYVRHGHLRFAPHMCELSFYNEMIYWQEGSMLPAPKEKEANPNNYCKFIGSRHTRLFLHILVQLSSRELNFFTPL